LSENSVGTTTRGSGGCESINESSAGAKSDGSISCGVLVLVLVVVVVVDEDVDVVVAILPPESRLLMPSRAEFGCALLVVDGCC
jgi:hypothetical protein